MGVTFSMLLASTETEHFKPGSNLPCRQKRCGTKAIHGWSNERLVNFMNVTKVTYKCRWTAYAEHYASITPWTSTARLVLGVDGGFGRCYVMLKGRDI
jgi:hypothetical protein